MARDYLAILALSCLAEQSFLMSARTDEAWCHQMGAKRFDGLQRLKSAYQDGWLKAKSEAWLAFDPDVDLDHLSDWIQDEECISFCLLIMKSTNFEQKIWVQTWTGPSRTWILRFGCGFTKQLDWTSQCRFRSSRKCLNPNQTGPWPV